MVWHSGVDDKQFVYPNIRVPWHFQYRILMHSLMPADIPEIDHVSTRAIVFVDKDALPG